MDTLPQPTEANARRIVGEMLENMTVTELAILLGVNSAHITNVKKEYRRPGPTLIDSMISSGLLSDRPEYVYRKIRKDDPRQAAEQIATIGRQYALEVHNELNRILNFEFD